MFNIKDGFGLKKLRTGFKRVTYVTVEVTEDGQFGSNLTTSKEGKDKNAVPVSNFFDMKKKKLSEYAK
jgi:hypothetical protein